MRTSPVLLMIFDGFGLNPSRKYNAWSLAKTPHLDEYFATNPHSALQASGTFVGLPDGQFGNSEVGHLTLGSGRVLEQELTRIAKACHHGEIAGNPNWQKMVEYGKRVHLIGLVSDGGVHSHLSHLIELLRLLVDANVEPVIHMVCDGRDTSPKSSKKYLSQLQSALTDLGSGTIATVSGRFWTMDRANNWDRTEVAYKAIMQGEGVSADSAADAIEQSYIASEFDEFIKPTVIGEVGKQGIANDEAVLFFNFRADRVRQLSAAIGLDEFEGFDRGDVGTRMVTTMTQYNESFPFPVLFEQVIPEKVLAEVISDAGKKQFHCAEKEKFPHVTYFFNGGREKPFEGEDRVMVESPKVKTYDMQPAMSSPEVAEELVKAINSGEYDFVLVNFANGDMVGHAALQDSVVKAVEALDECSHSVIEAALKNDFRVLLTADHGNCDEMVDPITAEPHTQHTNYPVPFLLLGEKNVELGNGRGLADIAPTILQLMGVEQPEVMTGKSLILGDSLI